MPRVFGHGELRLYLLGLLAEGPRHGYEIIKALSDRFGGTYAPSAGTIYPRLAKLQQEGLVATVPDGRRTQYRITDAGRAELAARQDDLQDVEADISASVRRLADTLRSDIGANMKGLRADLAATAEAAKSAAKASATATAGSAWTGPDILRGTGHPRPGNHSLHDAEALVQAFRDDIGIELRIAAAGRPVDELSVETIRTVLDQARIVIRATLGA